MECGVNSSTPSKDGQDGEHIDDCGIGWVRMRIVCGDYGGDEEWMKVILMGRVWTLIMPCD